MKIALKLLRQSDIEFARNFGVSRLQVVPKMMKYAVCAGEDRGENVPVAVLHQFQGVKTPALGHFGDIRQHLPGRRKVLPAQFYSRPAIIQFHDVSV